jgi:hypothetical protein
MPMMRFNDDAAAETGKQKSDLPALLGQLG